MPLTFNEEIELRAAFMEMTRERKNSLRAMFAGTQLKSKSKLEDAKTLATEAKALKAKVAAVPGVHVPKLDIPDLNPHLFKGINLRELVNFRIPTLTLPSFDPNLPSIDLSWIPDIKLGSLPGFSLPTVRLNLKGILDYKDLLPDISLRALAYMLAIKWPNISFPSLMFDFAKLLNIDFDIAFPGFKVHFPEFFDIDLNIHIPDLALPDLNIPNIIPQIDLIPDINLGSIDWPEVPGIDWPSLMKMPGFDKVMKLLFELFDAVDIGAIIGELGIAFLTDFISSAMPVVQQVKAGAGAAASWGKAAQDWHKARKTTVHRAFLLEGDARHACDAIAVLLRNSRNEHAALAAIQTTQLAVSTAGLFADLGGVTGPAVAAAAALAKTCQKVVIMGARYKEMKKVNLILSTSPADALDKRIFEISPLLGCYYIANNTTSNVLNVLCDNIIEDGWLANAEANKRNHLDPLIAEATRFIAESRYVLDPIRQNKGMYQSLGFTEKLKAGAILYVKKKVGMVPAHTRVATHKYVGR